MYQPEDKIPVFRVVGMYDFEPYAKSNAFSYSTNPSSIFVPLKTWVSHVLHKYTYL